MSGSAEPAPPQTGAPAGRIKKRRDFLRAASRGKRAARPGLVVVFPDLFCHPARLCG